MRLPAIHFLVAFETVARLKNLGKAAGVLCLTPSAVSHRIANLEEHLGVTLFLRHRDGLDLTSEGQRYLQALSGVLEQIAQAANKVGDGAQDRYPIRIRAAAGFNRYWLMPRLGAFLLPNPGVTVSLNASPDPPDFKTETVDLWVRRGRYSAQDLEVELLAKEEFVPLASPHYARQSPISSVQDLAAGKLLRCQRRYPTWVDWFQCSGQRAPDMSALMAFDNAADALDAAAHGLGVVLESLQLASVALADGKLERLLPEVAALQADGYHLLYPRTKLANHGVRLFREWLHVEFAACRVC